VGGRSSGGLRRAGGCFRGGDDGFKLRERGGEVLDDLGTDCGLYQLPRDVAFRKLRSLVAGTRIVRRELGRDPDGRL
jgi:hypothetical protein